MSLWERFRTGLERTRERLQKNLGPLLGSRGSVDADARVRLEEALLAADVGPGAAERLIERSEKLLERDAGLDLRAALERTAAEILGSRRARFEPAGGS